MINIVKITQKYGDSLYSVCFYTNNGRFKKYGGNGGSNVQNFTVGENERIIGVERSTNFCGKIIKILTQKKDDEKKKKGSGVEESKQ